MRTSKAPLSFLILCIAFLVIGISGGQRVFTILSFVFFILFLASARRSRR